MLAIYLGFILLVAFGRPLLSILLSPGLSLGILLGALTIVSCWILSIAYVVWANRGYDEAVARAVAGRCRIHSGFGEEIMSAGSNPLAILFFFVFIVAHAGRHLLGGAADQDDGAFLCRRARRLPASRTAWRSPATI